ncbi:OapB/ArvB family protein [Methanobrevibacter filiformis]|uniref:DUF2073 domain-containing protein n=1 Tax=Methanobrevibacter filiformis TaxID=55758 RepID=A0A165ZCV0_9EURY|nr:DUF2073 domain-containing protein [Methanobrevibacter filiformis]KZX10551.1 hypothetical protein MBFIL_17240 [Methanobrevibacter filiformis]
MNGLKMDFISSEALENASSMEKIYMIIERVKKGNIVVMEGGLTNYERTELIETTMREIDIENFVGIDVHTLEKDTTSFLGFSKKKTVVITIVGPANLMKTVKKQSNFLSMVADITKSDEVIS